MQKSKEKAHLIMKLNGREFLHSITKKLRVAISIIDFKSIFQTLVMTERVRSQEQASEMRFFTKNRKSCIA